MNILHNTGQNLFCNKNQMKISQILIKKYLIKAPRLGNIVQQVRYFSASTEKDSKLKRDFGSTTTSKNNKEF